MILIIEDDKSIAKLLELTLKTHDYKVKVASNGLTGLSIFLSDKAELILLDFGSARGYFAEHDQEMDVIEIE